MVRPDRSRLLVVALVLASACDSNPRKAERKSTPVPDELDAVDKAPPKPPQATAVDPCGPARMGLGSARVVRPWAAPPECTARTGPDGRATIADEKAFRRRFSCPAGIEIGIDFDTTVLVVEDRTLSPGGAGTTIVDDGATITFIERSRSPCPGDAQPMPVPYTLGFLLPKGAARAYASKSCTLPPTC